MTQPLSYVGQPSQADFRQSTAQSAASRALRSLASRLGCGDAQIGGWLAASLVCTGLVYSRSLNNEFIRDDNAEIVRNHALASWSFIWKSMVSDAWWWRDPLHLPQSSYYRPLQLLWFWSNFHLFALERTGWHAGLIAVHLLAVWVLFRVAALLTGNRHAALFATVIFALMPTHADALMNPAAIASSLNTLFLLGALELYLRHRSIETLEAPWRVRLLAGSIALFGCALLTYEQAAIFPVLIALYEYLFGPSEKAPGEMSIAGKIRRAIACTVPFLAVLAAYFGLRIWVLGFIVGPENPMTVGQVALTLPRAFFRYLTLIALPWYAGPVNRLRIVDGIGAPGFVEPALALAVLMACTWLLIRNHPHRRLYSVLHRLDDRRARAGIGPEPAFH